MEDERFNRALRVMKKLGLSSNVVAPAVEYLLQLYQGEWSYIEADEYRALTDHIFEPQVEEQNSVADLHIELSEPAQPDLLAEYHDSQDEQIAPKRKKRKRVLTRKSSSEEDSDHGHGHSLALVIRDQENGHQHDLDDKMGLSKKEQNSAAILEHLPSLGAAVKLISPAAIKAFGKRPQKIPDREIVIASKKAQDVLPRGSGSLAGPTSVINAGSDEDPSESLLRKNCLLPQDKKIDKIVNVVKNCALELFSVLAPEFSEDKLMENLCNGVLRCSKRLSDKEEVKNSLTVANSNEDRESNVVANGEIVKVAHDIMDISRGHENLPIPVCTEGTSESYPPAFKYIKNNIIYQNAYVNFAAARIGDDHCCSTCSGNCLDRPFGCPCATETKGEYAYMPNGLLKNEFLEEALSTLVNPKPHHYFYCKECPLERTKDKVEPESCKGHLIKKFIKECWTKCGCSKTCENRVVQRGITRKLEVFYTSKGKGWGVRTLEAIPKGAFVCEYVGEVVTNTELFDRNVKRIGIEKHTYPVLLDADWGSEKELKDEEALCLDATNYGNVARFINHRCSDATLMEIPVEIDSIDHHYYHLAFFTTRDVEPLEELNWDYGIDFDDKCHPIKAFKCLCGSEFCRDLKKYTRRKRSNS